MQARCALTAFALVLATRTASAEDGYAFRLSYEAPAGCPTKEAFSEAVTSNSARAHRVSGNEIATDIDALASIREGGFLGTLRIRRPDGTESTRLVPAPTCKETASAMAFIAAIAVDPDAASPSGELAMDPEPSPPALPLPLPAAPIAAPAGPRAADSLPRANERRETLPWAFGVNASIGLASAVAPDASPDFGGGLVFAATRHALLSPLGVLSAHVAESPSVSNSEGTARFERITGRLSGCPLRLDAAMVTIRPCAFFEAGQLRADGSRVHNQTTAKILWLGVGTAVRGKVEITGPLNLTLDLGAVFPLARDNFYFNPSRNPIHAIPAAGFLGVVGLGLRIL